MRRRISGRTLDSISPAEFERMEDEHEARELYAYLSSRDGSEEGE